jgi:hypothetical protein
MSLSRCLTLLTVAVVLSATSRPAESQVRTFRAPAHGGYAINYCGMDSSTCGEGVATAWCRSQSYDYATEWAATAGAETTTTVRLEDGVFCQGAACEAFASITCGGGVQRFTMPRIGAAGRATVLEPGRRSEAVAYETVEASMLIPGCHQREPGIFLCESMHEYQHCRTLMGMNRVHSCRAGLAFDGGFAIPVSPDSDEYQLRVKSDAEIRVTHGERGIGRVRGEAEVSVSFDQPETENPAWCLQRDRYVYYPTGPKGGLAEIDDTNECAEPIATNFGPNEDDVLIAYDLCDSFAAWGDQLTHTIDVVVAALFYLDSASPAFLAQYGASSTILAPYLAVKAPLAIDCRQ